MLSVAAKVKAKRALGLLGELVEDQVTGLVGVVVAVNVSAYAPPCLEVQPRGCDASGALVSSSWVYLDRVLPVDH